MTFSFNKPGDGDVNWGSLINANFTAIENALPWPAGDGGTGVTSYAAGDLLYASGASTLSKLGIGAADELLRSDGSVPQWSTLTSLLDTLSTTRGAVLYRGASSWAALGPGSAGQVLQSGGAGADPSWATAGGSGPHALLSATHTDTTAASVVRGDLVVGQGASAKWERLAIGSAGTVLRSDGTDAAWSAVALGTDVVGTLPVANGGTGATTASAARTNLGVAIGSDVQGFSSDLAAIAGLTSEADRVPYFTGSGTAALATFTAFGRSLVDDSDAATARSTLGLAIGTDVQAFDSQLSDLAGLSYAGNALKVVRVNAGESGFELATGTGSLSGITNGTAGQLAWSTGSGAITHLLGPTDQDFTIKGSSAGSSSTGRNLILSSGPGGSSSGGSGAVTIQPGSLTSGSGGAINLTGRAGAGSNNRGSSISITGGQSQGSSQGGDVTINAGASAGASGAVGGTVTIAAGIVTSNGVGGGALTLTGGSHSGSCGGFTLAGGSGNSVSGGDSTVAAGSSAFSGSNQAGGKLTLKSGLGTGTGNSDVVIQTGLAVSSGTTYQTNGDRAYFSGKRLGLPTTSGTTTTFALLSTGSNSGIGCWVQWTVEVSDGTNWAAVSGHYVASASNQGGTVTAQKTTEVVCTSNTSTFTGLTAAAAVSTSGTDLALRITPSWSAGTPSTVRVSYSLLASGTTTVTPQ